MKLVSNHFYYIWDHFSTSTWKVIFQFFIFVANLNPLLPTSFLRSLRMSWRSGHVFKKLGTFHVHVHWWNLFCFCQQNKEVVEVEKSMLSSPWLKPSSSNMSTRIEPNDSYCYNVHCSNSGRNCIPGIFDGQNFD